MTDESMAKLATEAWIYGYPLVTAAVTKSSMTAVPARDDSRRKAPVNQFCYMRATPDASFTEVVSPNADTLYSSAWLDLSDEPLVLALPEFGDRFWMVPVLDAWSNVCAVVGQRRNGPSAGPFLIAGPSWSEATPVGLTLLRSPTAVNWIIARYATSGPSDFPAVNRLQDGTRLVPLSQWTGDPDDYVPPVDVPVPAGADTTTAPVDQVHALSGREYFTLLNQMMIDNPPAPADAGFLDGVARVGIAPGARLDDLSSDALAALDEGARRGPQVLRDLLSQAESASSGGWTVHRGLGDYGTDYAKRAVITRFGYGANLDADALYPHATTDSDGRALDGSHTYVPLRRRGHPARRRLLVPHDDEPATALRRQPARPVRDRRSQRYADQPRRVPGHPCPARAPRARTREQLAPRPGGQLQRLPPPVPAPTGGPQRRLDAAHAATHRLTSAGTRGRPENALGNGNDESMLFNA